MESTDLHTYTHCSLTLQIPINTDKLGYLPATQGTCFAVLARMLKESLPSPKSLLSFLAAARREGPGGQVETNFWTCKFIAIKFLVLSAAPIHPMEFPFPKLDQDWLFWLEVVAGRVAGERGNSLPCSDALCSRTQTLPRVQFWEAVLGAAQDPAGWSHLWA